MNNPRSINSVFFLAVCAGMVSLAAGDRLDGYLATAAENNPGLKARFNEYLAALEKVPQVGALPDPQVTFGYFIRPVETRVGPQQARFSVSQMFPWFGTLGSKKDAAAAMAKAKYETFEEAKSRLFFDVKAAYYALYFTRKATGITQENITLLGTFRKLALIKVEAGLASSVDVLRVEMEIADLENQRALLDDHRAALTVTFNNLCNADTDRAVAIPDSLFIADHTLGRSAMLDSIRSNNHRILRLDLTESSYEKQAKAAKKSGLPNLMLGMDYVIVGKSSGSMAASGESGNDAIMFPMISISLPLYRTKYRAMVKEAALLRQSANNEKRDRINLLEAAFAKTDKEYRDAARRIRLHGEQVIRAQKALNMLRANYETSGADFAELLRMERKLLGHRLELEKARADKGAAIAFIDHLMGH